MSKAWQLLLFCITFVSGRLGNDLLAINLERAREHGIPGYNAYRELASLKKATTWTDFVEIPYDRRMKLQQLYRFVFEIHLCLKQPLRNKLPIVPWTKNRKIRLSKNTSIVFFKKTKIPV